MTHLRAIALFWLLLSGVSPNISAQTIESGPKQVQMIELFTSEGCSSCPAAERWLSGLLENPDLWKRFVPIAFHVDYWNGLGWPDPFAQADYSQRQRIYQQQGNVATVYTPGFVIQGQEWRGFFGNRTRPSDSVREVGNLSVQVEPGIGRVAFSPEQDWEQGILHLAWLGCGYEREIERGENAGKTLHEDFIVLGHQERDVGLKNHRFDAEFDLRPPAVGQDRKLALVAWFSSPENQRPIQAAGGWYASDDAQHP